MNHGLIIGEGSAGRFPRPIRRWLALLGGVLLLLAAFWLRPAALFLYHLRAGERALETALIPVYPDRLAPEQVRDAALLTAGIGHLEAAVRWNGRDVRPLRLLGRAYLSSGRPDGAVEVLERAVALRPDDPQLHLELADVYDNMGRTEDAIREYEAGGVGSRRAPLAANYLKLADFYAERGNGDLAIAFWRRALEVDPENLYALYRLVEIHRGLGDEATAAIYEARLRGLAGRNIAVPLDFRLAEYQGRAMARLVQDGIWERDALLNLVSYQVSQFADGVYGLMTRRNLETILAQWPEDPDLLFYLAELFHRRGEWDQAEAAYRRVLAIAPEYAQASLRLAMIAEER